MRRQVAYVGELLDEAADLVYTVFDALLTAAAPDTMVARTRHTQRSAAQHSTFRPPHLTTTPSFSSIPSPHSVLPFTPPEAVD